MSGRKMEDPPPCVVQDEEMPPPLPPPSNATSAPNATAAVNSALMRGECNFCAKLSQSVKVTFSLLFFQTVALSFAVQNV